jgi:hypothetical protein
MPSLGTPAPSSSTSPWSPPPGNGGSYGEPADQPPTLAPGAAQGIQPIPESRNYPPDQSGDVITRPKPDETVPLGTPGTTSQKPVPLTDPEPALKPVPDLDAANGRKQVPAAPSLFDPRDRTASRGARRAWAVSPIVWPDSARTVEARTVTAEIPVQSNLEPRVAEPRVADPPVDDGWRSVRP